MSPPRLRPRCKLGERVRRLVKAVHDELRLWTAQPAQVWFTKSAGVALSTTAVGKLLSAIGPSRALDIPDPVVGVPFRQLLVLVGLVELAIAFFCLFTDNGRFSLLALAWVATNFLLYRLTLWFAGWHHPCACMGSLAGMLHLSDRAADNIMKGMLVYLLLGSYGVLFWQSRAERRARLRAREEKQEEGFGD
jgi:hypothetical protein